MGKKPFRKVNYKAPDDEAIHEALFTKLLDAGTVIGPIELSNGDYIVMRILNWGEKGLTLRQLTQYPEEQGTTLEFECKNPVSLTLKIRYPYWAEKGFEIFVNGQKKRITSKPGILFQSDGNGKLRTKLK